MNIVIATPEFPTDRFPFTGVYVVEQARALYRQGHKVSILCARQMEGRGLRFAFEETSYGDEGLPVIKVEYPIIRGASYIPCVIALRRALRKVKRYFEPDLIHAHVTLPVGFAAVVCGKVLGIPVAVTEHWGPVRQICDSRLGEWGMRFVTIRADRMIAVSEHLKQEMISELDTSRPIDVIPNLYDPFKFYRADNGSEPQSADILFVGRGGDLRKGNDLVLKSFARAMQRSTIKMRLVMVGSGLEKELAPLVSELGIAGDCVFTGALPLDRLSSLMRRCAFLVVASRYETFSLVLVEAMACGKPVIATRCGGPEGLVTSETGMLVPVDDTEAMADAMVEMSRDLARYDARSIARHARESYGEDVIARQLTRMYEGVINRS
ncbi:MAG TPA: glycosyltransferase [Blastocatellia bacterium]|nr:glycosyltransferase [Blastocatellia bacterium]